MAGQLQQFQNTLPTKPYATDNLAFGLRICFKQKAITKKYLQHNPPAKIHWLVFDCDKAGALEVASMQYPCPAPSFEVVNPINGHSHLFYGLTIPVVRTELGRAKPLAYLAVIEYALREVLGADAGYSGLISKNPLHPAWQVIEHQSELWSLGELAEFLTLPDKLPTKAKLIGLGRNCSLFEVARRWAYKNVLTHKVGGSQETFGVAMLKVCEGFNQFPEPLPFSEVKAIAKSITRWVWKNYTGRLTNEKFAQVQAQRGKKGGTAKGAKNQEKRLQARSMASSGATQASIAKAVGVGQGTISKWLKTV